MEIVLIVAVADNGVIGSARRHSVAAEDRSAALQGDDVGKPVVMGRKTFLSLRRPLPGRTNIVVTRDPSFRAAGAVVTTSFADARAVARGDALRRSADEIAVIGGAEIYAQWMDIADRLEITEVHARPEGDTMFRRNRSGRLGGGRARAESGRSGRQRRLFLCDLSPPQAALTRSAMFTLTIAGSGIAARAASLRCKGRGGPL